MAVAQTWTGDDGVRGPCAAQCTVVTTADGAATEYLGPFTGFLNRIVYTLVDFAAGVDFTITLESTGENLWTQVDQNASAVKAPRTPTHDGVGAASLYAATGEPVEDRILLANDRIKIVIAKGGKITSGTFKAYVS